MIILSTGLTLGNWQGLGDTLQASQNYMMNACKKSTIYNHQRLVIPTFIHKKYFYLRIVSNLSAGFRKD